VVNGKSVWGRDMGVHQDSLKGVNIKGHSIKVWKFVPEDWMNDGGKMGVDMGYVYRRSRKEAGGAHMFVQQTF